MSNEKVYLAGPFFDQDEEEAIDQLEELLDGILGEERVYSPRRIGVLPPDASKEERARIFKGNLEGIDECDFMVAQIEGFDPGTLIEMGMMYQKGGDITAYSYNPQRSLNVMIAEMCIGYANNLEDLESIVKRYLSGEEVDDMWEGPVE